MDPRPWIAAAALAAIAAVALPASARPLAAAEPLLVFAAASLADALADAGAAWEQTLGQPVEYNFAGSDTLAQQIVAGAPADLFISADEAQMARAASAGRIDADAVVPLLGNRLVVIVPAARAVRFTAAADLLQFPRLAVADPEGVPAGVYARRWLERQGLWKRLAPRVVPTLDVRAALAAVAAGHLPAGVVYATDAATTDRVAVAFRVPEGEAPQVRYVGAPVTGGREAPATALLRFLGGEQAGRIFARYGFLPLPAPAAAPLPAVAP